MLLQYFCCEEGFLVVDTLGSSRDVTKTSSRMPSCMGILSTSWDLYSSLNHFLKVPFKPILHAFSKVIIRTFGSQTPLPVRLFLSF